MRKLAALIALMFAVTLTACSVEAPHANLGAAQITVTQSATIPAKATTDPSNAVVTPADECFIEALAFDPASGECVTPEFWAETPGLLLP